MAANNVTQEIPIEVMSDCLNKQSSPSNSLLMSKVNKNSKKPLRWTWKKPKGKPCRPMSAYNFFFKCERTRILSQNQKSGGFGNLAKVTSAKWNVLSCEDKRTYQQQADHEKVKYHIALKEWKIKNDVKISNQVENSMIMENETSMTEIGINLPLYDLTDSEAKHCTIQSVAKDHHITDNLFGCDENYTDNRNIMESSITFEDGTITIDDEINDSNRSDPSIRSVTPFSETLINKEYDQNVEENFDEDIIYWLQQQPTSSKHNNNAMVPENYCSNDSYFNEHQLLVPVNQSNIEIDTVYDSSINECTELMSNYIFPNLNMSKIHMDQCTPATTSQGFKLINSSNNNLPNHNPYCPRYNDKFSMNRSIIAPTSQISETSIQQLSAAFDNEAIELLSSILGNDS